MPPIHLPPLALVARYRRRRVSLLALMGEAVMLAAAFFALGFGLVVAAALLQGAPQ